MPSLSFVALSVMVLLAGCADSAGSGAVSSRVDDGQGPMYHTYAWTDSRAIPDGAPGGLLLGPLMTENDSSELGAIMLRLDIRHPAPSDLDMWLAYDADGDGNPETRAPVEFHRSRSDIHGQALHAFPRWAEGTYFFRDGLDDDNAAFQSFRALPRGHAFYLVVADTLAEYAGSIQGWAVYTKVPDTASR
jgi:hypothetical protein